VVTADAGKLAFYRQKREGLDEFIEGEGEVIEYDGRADTVKFIGKAQLRRYRGSTLNDEMTGAVILYNNITDVFSINGTVAKASPGVPAGRVRAMLTPTPDASAKPVNGALPVLRATPALGGASK
jgi:lipopolysaccharide export system protein LptA